MKKKINLSVHELVDFVLRSGDIDDRIFNLASMTRGTHIHTYYQQQQNDDYKSEYAVEETFKIGSFEITLRGFADGVIFNNGKVIIEEIKSTNIDLDEFFLSNSNWHLGQAQCYALMIAHELDLEIINIHLVYINQLDEEKKTHKYSFFTKELEEIVIGFLSSFLSFYDNVYNHKRLRNQSAKNLPFPFENKRNGQEEMLLATKEMLKNGGITLIEAPTGIGKTMAVLYPTAKEFYREKLEKVFYFTAKGSTQKTAYDALDSLIRAGLHTKGVFITAKEKICVNETVACNPEECPYTKNYYGKLKDILFEMINNDNLFDKETILKYALKHGICPFELQLDISLFVDYIIGDYNYLFDPNAYLRRFFDDYNDNYVSLIDEAHNLVERVRDNYSVLLEFYSFYTVKKELRSFSKRKFKTTINKVIAQIELLKELTPEEEGSINEVLVELNKALISFNNAAQTFIYEYTDLVSKTLKDLYFDVSRYLKLSEISSENLESYVVFKEGMLPALRILCLDPSSYIREGLLKTRGSLLFSATLGPLNFYKDVLGIEENDTVITLPNPFPRKNLLLMIATDVATTYKKRDETYGEVADYILAAISAKVGNYLIYCPSYAYLENIKSYLETKDDYDLVVQTKDMNDEERVKFLNSFVENPSRSLLGLTVMGGIFSEGIDLPDDRLIGVIIIGVGFPRMDEDLDRIYAAYRRRYDGKGFAYTYINPGINRVLQAMGRLIRSETDKGFVLLVDERYLENPYRTIIHSYNGLRHYVDNPSHAYELTHRFFVSIETRDKKCDNATNEKKGGQYGN